MIDAIIYILTALVGFLLGMKLMDCISIRKKRQEEIIKIKDFIYKNHPEYIKDDIIRSIGGVDAYNALLKEFKEEYENKL